MIIKTIKLYDSEPYAAEFSAKVISCEKINNTYGVVLDRTLFFPEEGGQACDVGEINGIKVEKVEIKNGVVTHLMPSEFTPESKVNGKIDFLFRYRNMQNHSGEHIFSGLVNKTLGFNNVGFHLGSTDMTMDYDGELTSAQIEELEDKVNDVIYENIDIIAKYYDSAQLEDILYRSKLSLTEDVRIVTIGKYDTCACCAPHVARTGEIGIFKVTDFYRYKGGTRVHALCGVDALKDYRQKHNMAKQLTALLSSKPEDTVCSVQHLMGENSRLSADISAVTRKYCLKLAQDIPQDSEKAVIFEDDISRSGMQIIANAAMQKAKWCAVFSRTSKNTFSFVIASEVFSAKDILASLSKNLGAKGGGNDKMVQGTVVSSKKEIEQILHTILF